MNSGLKNLARLAVAIVIIGGISILIKDIPPISKFAVGFCGGALMMFLFILIDKIK